MADTELNEPMVPLSVAEKLDASVRELRAILLGPYPGDITEQLTRSGVATDNFASYRRPASQEQRDD